MYKHNANQLTLSDEVFLPFGDDLNPNNRWIIIAPLIPWSEVEEHKKRLETPMKRVRLTLIALIWPTNYQEKIRT